MTDTVEVNINEALALIDQCLGLTMSRELMSTTEERICSSMCAPFSLLHQRPQQMSSQSQFLLHSVW